MRAHSCRATRHAFSHRISRCTTINPQINWKAALELDDPHRVEHFRKTLFEANAVNQL
jgi:hypothetical protein